MSIRAEERFPSQNLKSRMAMIDFYRQMALELERGAVVLATVITVKGSVPREVGAKMLVTADGIIGTIGGGAGEAKVCNQALTVLKSGEKQFVEVDLSGALAREIQGVCGGNMRVWLERWAGKASLALVNQILNVLKSGQSGAIATPFILGRSPYLNHAINLKAIQLSQHEMIEPLVAPPILVIVGAGHIAVPLAQVAQIAGFQIIAIDDRPEFAKAERFPMGATVLAQPVGQALEALPSRPYLYAALVTRGYQHDLEPLKVLLNRPLQYIGMIGSKKRVQLVQQALLQMGYPYQLLNKIHAPIGLDIGALTPEEIAVSICAEIIQVRRGGTGQPLSVQMQTVVKG